MNQRSLLCGSRGAPSRASISGLVVALCALVLSVSAVSAATPAKGHAPRPANPTGFGFLELVPSDVPAKVGTRKLDVTANAHVAGKALNGGFDGPLEIEPNPDSATATPIAGATARLTGNIFPAGDLDVYSFTAAADDRIYAALQTAFDASASGDSVLDLLNTDGSTVLESDNNDGTFNANGSSIAGFRIPAAGTYFLRVRHNASANTIRPYSLHFSRQTVAPIAETETNNTPATATPMPASGHVSGTITGVSPGESDFYSIDLDAGDTVFLSLDMNPERNFDVAAWNGRLGFGLFGNTANQTLVANDANGGASMADPNSEAFFFTVLTAGTYYIYVDSIVANGLGVDATYLLNATVQPQPTPAGSCTTYTSTDVPAVIPSGPGQVSSTITIPGNPRIADLDVQINLNHTFMQDLDVHLVSPAGNDNGLFTDIGSGTSGGAQTLMDVVFDDEAALPPAFAMTGSFRLQPELAYRLSWFDGENAGGLWTLVIRDDASGDGGTLNSWSLRVCEPPPPPVPACPVGQVETTVYSTEFESGAAGFTHSGAGDEWELGLPTFVPLTSCNSGTNCWVTDLDDTYNANSSQDLLSPAIDLTGLAAPVTVHWAQRYHIESASFDHYHIDAREVGNPSNAVRLFEWLGATMNNTIGNPTVTIAESAGWAQFEARVDSLAGLNTELQFHLDGDTTVQLAGVAIDDVSVTACRALSADLSITKTDGVDVATPGEQVVYTIVASNGGGDDVSDALITDTFTAALSCSWTCAGSGGASCSAGGVGDIGDVAMIPAGDAVTYTATCDIAASATGGLANTASVSSAIADPDTGNNSAIDVDTLQPLADLSITKTNGATSSVPGTTTVYTITASNAGPSDVPSATVGDLFPQGCDTVTWACVGTGGGTCTANGSGDISDFVSLPVGDSVTYTASCDINPFAPPVLSNTAAVSSAMPDPDVENNTAIDTDTMTPVADLAVTLVDTPDPVTGGTNLAYTASVSHTGPSYPVDVALELPVAGEHTFVSAVASIGSTCTTPPVGSIGVVSCEWLGETPTGVVRSIEIVTAVVPDAGGPILAMATATSGTTDPDANNNEASASTTVIASADLTLAVTDTPDPVNAGNNLAYAATASNAGPSDADDLALSFPLDADTAFVSAVASAGGVCVTPAVGASGQVDCTWAGPTAPGSARTLDVVVAVDAAATGSLLVAAVVSSTAADPAPADNLADVSTAVNAAADLSITLTDAPDPVAAGANLTYLATLANAGSSDAQDAGIATATPPDTTFVSAAASVGGVCVTPAVGASGAVNCTWAGSIDTATDRTLSLVVLVDEAAVGPILASATALSATGDPDIANNTANASTVVEALSDEADLSLVLADAPDPVTAGEALTYTATATNVGPNDAQDVSIVVDLPADTVFVSAAAAGGACVGSGPVNCTWAGATANGAARVATVTVDVDGAAMGPLLANASTTSAVADPVAGNNTANASTVVELLPGEADLSLALADAPDPVTAGEALTYTATATNAGPDDAQDVSITVDLPAETTFVSAAVAGGACVGSGPVTCSWPGTTANGAARVATVTVDVDGGAVGPLLAGASTTSAVADPVAGDNAANASTVVEPASVVADLAIALQAAPAVAEPGDALMLTASGSNAGPDGADTVVIEIALGANVLFDTVDPGAGGVCVVPAVGSPGVVTCTYAGATASGTQRVVVVTATAGEGDGPANISATIESDTADPTPADAHAASVIVIAGGTVVPPTAAIPAVIPATDRYTLLLLVLLLGLGGMVLLRRRM